MFYSINKKAKNLQKHIETAGTEDSFGHLELDDSLMRKHDKYSKEKKHVIYDDELFSDTTVSVFPSNLKFCSNESPKIAANFSSVFDNIISGERNTNRKFLESNEILSSRYENERNIFGPIPEPDIFNQTSMEKQNSEKRSSSKYKADYSMARKIQNLNGRFIKASILVQETDDIFSLQVLAVLTITFVRTCTYIYIYISTDWKNHDPYAGVSIAIQIFYDFLAFGSVATDASLVAEEAKKFALLIMRVHQIDKTKEMRSLLQSEIAALTAYATNVQLTAWKFFTVSRNFIPTVIGVTVTYVIVILQLYQVIQDSKCMKEIMEE
ncbi:uncharacterized protein TNCT_537621 [Trichonephila clavata]|uniref:Gustatory receptor n=1 Tax=Trichonephila clavata TaxID=2740835 RepID=A0A8X6KY91_TRICU|nr:uncharacterized protein TNCT_537621 [Trichonephila clavata]